ncbi:PH domain-containing protein [Bowmanella denitrificans]|uniref:PH domain-containing protein n=1 Tax=Bowmanella denitrificans TaxID=366582 RepID=UPI000C9A52D8|nr:PH domain-containing protein [Bowmanella denitrificans]
MSQILFTNQSLSVHNLADVTALEMQRLSPRYAPLNLLCGTIFLLFLLTILAAIRWQTWLTLPDWYLHLFPLIFGGLVAVGLLWLLYDYLADKRKGYAVREQDLSYQSGLFFQSLVTQPILRVQHVELKRGPIERKAGLATLQVFSAGGSLYTFAIPGLPEADARKLRQFILSHSDVSQDG